MRSVSSLLSLHGLQFLRTALSIKQHNVGQLANGHAVSVMPNILRIAGGASPIGVQSLAKWVKRLASSLA